MIQDEIIDLAFKSFPEGTIFYWYTIAEDRYIGMLDIANGGVTYRRDKRSVVDGLSNLHRKFIEETVILTESNTTGMPNVKSPVFYGSEWKDEWS